MQTDRRVVAEATRCSHLGLPGRLTLEFQSDVLLKVEFTPDDETAYLAAVTKEIGQAISSEAAGSVGEDVSVSLATRGRETVVIWLNRDLFQFFVSR